MFKALIKRLFKKKKVVESNIYYFEQNSIRANESSNYAHNQNVQHTQTSPVQSPLVSSKVPLTLEQEFQNDFYDFLFGKPRCSQAVDDELAQFISEKIALLLKQPELILDSLPILPMSLTKVVEQLNNKEFDTDALIKLIQTEPAIAAKVIELANSAFYNRSNKAITDLKSAFMTLGIKGLSEGVINGFISRLTPQSNIYFRHYGKKIWEHSLSTGNTAKALLKDTAIESESPQAYLLGLVSNLGDVIIYQLMVEAFSVVHPDCQPNSQLFKEMMAKNAKKLTYFIAKFWHFPPVILDVLAIQAKLKKPSLLPALYKKNPLACYIYEAKVISELEMRMQAGKLDKTYIDEVSTALIYSPSARQYVHNLFNQ